MLTSVIDDFRCAIESTGISAPEAILADGRLHRFSTNGDLHDDAGWYVLYPDGIPAGAFGCWRSGINKTWCAQTEQTMTVVELSQHRSRIKDLQEKREETERHHQTEAALRASTIWAAASIAQDEHPYLLKKGAKAHGIREHQGQLVIPMRDEGDILHSLQLIDDNGAKRFLCGGRIAGCFHLMGQIGKTVCISEGYATGASLYQATGLPVVVAFSAGNLLLVARAITAKYPNAKIVICGDHDRGGVGQEKAKKAALEVAGMHVIPNEPGTDWNDIAVNQGPEAVRYAFKEVLTPATSVLDEVHHFLGRFVAYPSKHAHRAHTLWVAHTHLMDAWESTPRLAALSPEPGSGKTRLLEITETLVPRPVEAINATPAYLFRKVSDPEGLPTILHDEIDTIFGPKAREHEEIRGIINAGHRRGAMAGRCVVKGKIIETEELPAYCAVAMAGLGGLPDTILTRSVIIRMRRRTPSEKVQPYRRRIHSPEGYQLRDRLAEWSAQIRSSLNPYPDMPQGITDRDADVWESLLAIADVAGGDWPKLARVAAVALVADAKGGKGSLGVQLLTDLKVIFGDRDAMGTADILDALNVLEEAPWGDLKGKPLDSRRLADLLRPYGISPKGVRINKSTPRGYERQAFHDAWCRYLPSDQDHSSPLSPHTAATSATTATAEEDAVFEVFEEETHRAT